jgi:uncharacterized protein with FMN-binding domain
MTTLQKKHAIAAFAALSLATTLAGCTAAAETTGTDTGSSDSGTDTGTTSGTYTDGTYTESGSYNAPSGTETVEVTVTLEGNTITDVSVVGEASDPQAKRHQSEFSDGIAAAVVGKNIDEISVDKIGGSSLTSGGFNEAIDAIKSDAAA